jgi:hypothetical protein
MFKTSFCVRAMWLLLVALLGIGLSGCKAETPEEKQARICREMDVPADLQTTISSDGKMIAVLSYVDNCGKKRLRYKNVDPEGPWQELPIGTGVDSIRFGLKGHELMVTRNVREGAGTWLGNEVNKVDSWSELYKVDLDHPQKSAKTMLEGYGLALPIEIIPGEYMVMNCIPNQNKQCHRLLGYEWNLIKDGKLVHKWTHGRPDAEGKEYRGALNYGWPNVMLGQGLYWLKADFYRKQAPFTNFWTLTLLDKNTPAFNKNVEDETTNIDCDYRMERCVRTFSLPLDETNHPQGFNREVLWRDQRCDLDGVIGTGNTGLSLTPNGLAAVTPLHKTHEAWHHVVVFKFAAQQCKPTSIQHIYLEGK